jgi:peptide/nickel transport system ATP-binding protein
MSSDRAETLVSVRDLTVDFRVSDTELVRAVDGVSFDIEPNSTVALVGESGSGKSVTALAMLGLLPTENAVVSPRSRALYRGADLLRMSSSELQATRGRTISMVFQEPMSSLNPVFTVGFQVTEALARHTSLTRAQARAQAVELLDEVGLPEPELKLRAYPFQLSGGQQQRVMIAMAIACKPELLIADEPTTALDVTVQKQILELIRSLQRQHAMAVLFITHDLALVREVADRVIVMREGKIKEQAPVEQLFSAPADPYTKALLACRPQLTRRPAKLPVIDDFLNRSTLPAEPRERSRGLTGKEPVILEAHDLSKSFFVREGVFRWKEFRAVKSASFKLARGKTLGIVGESGSGKTTLALMLVRLQPPTAGRVMFEGEDLLASSSGRSLEQKRRMQIIFQNPYASLNPRFTAGQILIEPMRIHDIGIDERERRDLAYGMLEKVGLPAHSFFKYPHEFSGGQRQRIAIARCLTLRPDVLICDESVSALDVSVQAQLLNLLQSLQDEYGMSYLFISHDLAVVKYMADEVMVMREGEIVEIANSDDIYARPQHPYTRELLASMPAALRSTETRA